MEKVKRSERLGILTRILMDTPNRVHSFAEFCELFGATKASICEDIDMLSECMERFEMGRLETVPGVAGGVRYRAIPSMNKIRHTLADAAEKLCQPGRMLPGDFLYNTDISSDPVIAQSIGEILAAQYYEKQPDFVLTMETKGIPIALMTARMLDVRLVIARRDSCVYDGSAVKINYMMGSGNGRIETMALARKAVEAGERALIIDDFMKGGGTLKGMVDMMREFQAEVVGIGVMIATAEPRVKRVQGARPLLILEGFDESRDAAYVYPAEEYR